MMKYKHTHPILPPSLLISPISKKKYIVPGWKEVHQDTTLNDIEWVKEKIEAEKTDIQLFEFKSSNGSETYVTKKYTNIDGSVKYQCSCPGMWRAKDKSKGCKHIQEIRSQEIKNPNN